MRATGPYRRAPRCSAPRSRDPTIRSPCWAMDMIAKSSRPRRARAPSAPSARTRRGARCRAGLRTRGRTRERATPPCRRRTSGTRSHQAACFRRCCSIRAAHAVAARTAHNCLPTPRAAAPRQRSGPTESRSTARTRQDRRPVPVPAGCGHSPNHTARDESRRNRWRGCRSRTSAPPDRDGHHPRLAHAVALAQSTGERHRFVIALRAEELVDVGAVLREMGAIELLAAGELEDDRDQLDSGLDADAEGVRGARLCGCCCRRDDECEAEGDRAKPHNASLTATAGARRATYTPTRQSAPPNTATRQRITPTSVAWPVDVANPITKTPAKAREPPNSKYGVVRSF